MKVFCFGIPKAKKFLIRHIKEGDGDDVDVEDDDIDHVHEEDDSIFSRYLHAYLNIYTYIYLDPPGSSLLKKGLIEITCQKKAQPGSRYFQAYIYIYLYIH